MNHGVAITQDKLWTLTLCSLRYAMGRSSYIVGVICDHIRDHDRFGNFEPHQRVQMVKEIREEIAICERSGRTLGMAMDHAEWTRLADHLEVTK